MQLYSRTLTQQWQYWMQHVLFDPNMWPKKCPADEKLLKYWFPNIRNVHENIITKLREKKPQEIQVLHGMASVSIISIPALKVYNSDDGAVCRDLLCSHILKRKLDLPGTLLLSSRSSMRTVCLHHGTNDGWMPAFTSKCITLQEQDADG